MKRILAFVLLLAAFTTAAQSAPHSATLTWTASPTASVTYNVYWSATTGGPYTIVNTAPVTAVTFTDTVHTSGFWVVTAVLPGGGESLFSNEFGVPNPPSALTVVAH